MPTDLDIRRRLQRWIPSGSPLTADDLIEGSRGTGLDPRLLAIIARKESEFGKTSGRFRNNAFGYNVHNSPNAKGPSFSNWREGVRAVASDLVRNYVGKGKRTVSTIIPTYAPPSENDTGLYVKQLHQWAKELGMNPNQVMVNGAQLGDPAPETPAGSGGAVTAPGSGGTGTNAAAELLLQRAQTRGRSTRALALNKIIGDDAAGAATGLLGAPSIPNQGDAPEVGGDLGTVVDAAQDVKGTPYSWGGGSPSGPTKGIERGANTTGFDCSSLVQYAWAKVGVKLPRVTYDQIKVGKAINGLKNARPGDLLFPSTGHVMMYIGNGKAIHAPKTGDVVRETDATTRSYIAIRRPG